MIKLEPMQESEYQIYIRDVIDGYATEQVEAGAWLADRAKERARAEIEELLPAGLATPNQYLYHLVTKEEKAPVGVLWILLRERNDQKEAFIEDIVIFDTFRRRGYAKQALSALEELAKGMGINKIRLQVFGHNLNARDLYEKCGFQTINIYMEKQI